MPIVIDVLATVAALCTAVIFGTDVLTAVVLRPALAEIDDQALVQITGRTHRFGDQRLPLPGILSVVAAAATVIAAFIAGSTAAGVLSGVGLILLGVHHHGASRSPRARPRRVLRGDRARRPVT